MFHETLAAAVETAKNEILSHKGIIVSGSSCPFQSGGMVYGEVKSADYELESYKGKKTKKYAHITITRFETGRYEQVNYIL